VKRMLKSYQRAHDERANHSTDDDEIVGNHVATP
jgi:hypothetical protein